MACVVCGGVSMNLLSDRASIFIYLFVIPIVVVTSLYSEMFLWLYVAIITVLSMVLTISGEY